MSRGKVLFQLSGSIACFKACNVLSRLVQNDFEIEVVATRSALQFVGLATLEGLTGKPVHVEMFETGRYMNHIDLMKWADVVVLCPATANTIAKLANGSGDDLVSALFLAHDFKKPYLISPAMNVNMYNHPATRESMAKLSAWGVQILETEAGRLACGDVGEGRLLDPERIYARIEEAFRGSEEKTLSGQRILVTAGGTKEPLDGVRYLTNISSGKTGATLATELATKGADVTFLHAEGSVVPASSSVRQKTFSSYVSLERALRSELQEFDYTAVIHAAAVGDFSIESIETSTGTVEASADGKLESTSGIRLKLKRNPKLLTSLKTWSKNDGIRVIGFKLTNSSMYPDGKESVRKLVTESNPSWVVQNDLSEISENRHPFRIYDSTRLLTEVDGATKLADFLADLLSPGGHA
jgi:phosphopantothenoylcysteine decarboxylase/phosphopantothenate--cysteine ligase